MIKVFISHPLTGNFAVNRASADRICRRLAKQGLLPISPLHLFSFYETEDQDIRDAVLQVCFRLIDLCDEVWMYGDSEGCRMEADYAERSGKVVRNQQGYWRYTESGFGGRCLMSTSWRFEEGKEGCGS